MEDEWKDWRCIKQKGGDKKKMKKLLPVVILAVVVVLCSASTITAQPTLTIDPQKQYASPQISEFWGGASTDEVCHADKTVTYNIFVQNGAGAGLVSVAVNIGNCDISWVDNPENAAAGWSFPDISQTIWLNANEGTILPLYINVPLTLGKDAGGTYNFEVTAGGQGWSFSTPATLVVQDHDYVTETLIAGTGDVTIKEKVRNMAIATSVDKVIDFHGTVDALTKNEYLIVDAKGNNANFEQEAVVSEYRAILPTDYLYGDERFKSCAVMGGTGANIHEEYVFDWVESRCENINHHVTGDQKRKTELCTYNRFNGTLLIDARQSVPCSIHREDSKIAIGNLTVGQHIIFRRLP